jgi:hypothetical protein
VVDANLKAIDLKCRQMRWLAGLVRMFAPIGRDDLDYVEEEDPTLEVVDFTGPIRRKAPGTNPTAP